MPFIPRVHYGVSKKSAGLLPFREANNGVEVLLVHPGGPFWAKKDEGAWSIPKGEFADDENPLAAARRDIDVHFHTPSEVKAAVTGNGRADKAQVTTMVTRILGLQAKPTPADAADALALAICHCWRAPMIARMAEAEAKVAEQRKKFSAKVKAAR